MSLEASEARLDGKTVQVLEFGLDDQRYCVEIAAIAEIVDGDALTAVPDSQPHVVGMMNLRGETTTIVDPKVVFGLGQADGDSRVIVFDGDGEQFGWLVDHVYQVSTIRTSDVEDRTDADSIRGLINRESGFLIWADPTVINATS
jgi:purine-binding chemotaxis protein CheW